MNGNRHVTGDVVVDAFHQTAATSGYPASVLTDNGLVYTARFAGGQAAGTDSNAP